MTLINFALTSLGAATSASSTSSGYSASAVINGLRYTNGNTPSNAWASSGAVPQWVGLIGGCKLWH